MNIRARHTIHETADQALLRAPSQQKIILVYAAICCGLSLCVTVISALLSDRISGTGGLGNIGLRSVLSTGQSVLPLVNLIVTTCLSLGYHIAILSITRGYEATPKTLTAGFRYLGPLLRCMLLQGLVYCITGLGAVYLSSFIFMATPLADPFVEIMTPLLSSSAISSGIVVDDATLAAATDAMMPMMWILLAVCLVVMTPIYYRFRMVTFCLADDPRKGALHALSKSKRLMLRNCFALFRLDLDLWWFYLAQVLITVVCYGDVLLPMAGVSFPWSNTVSYYLFFVLSLVLQTLLYCFGMNRVYAAYAVAYDALQDQQPKPNLPVQM